MWTIYASLLLGIAAWLIFPWSVRTGQFNDPERLKYRMLDEGGKGE